MLTTIAYTATQRTKLPILSPSFVLQLWLHFPVDVVLILFYAFLAPPPNTVTAAAVTAATATPANAKVVGVTL